MRFSPSVSHPICLLFCIVGVLSVPSPQALTQGQTLLVKQDSSGPKRKLKFRHAIPAPVKILDIRHLQDDDWYNNIEFEVQNVGDKPIYYLLIWLTLQELKPQGVPAAFMLVHGDGRLVSFDEPLDSSDKPINPGDKVVLTTSEAQRRGATWRLEHGQSLDVREIEVSVNIINFGDGTGYLGGVKAVPRKRN